MLGPGWRWWWSGAFLVVLALWFYQYTGAGLMERAKMDQDPFIIGKELCQRIAEGDLQLELFSLNNMVNTLSPNKVALYGRLDGDRVVVKELGSPGEQSSLESLASTKFIRGSTSVESVKREILSALYTPFEGSSVAKLHICPALTTVEPLLQEMALSPHTLAVQDYLHLWTLLKLNPEPLLLKVLRGREWGVGRLLGTCGRLSVVEYRGGSINMKAGWADRANLSHQLLSTALRLTLDHPRLAFYLTDVSPDNIAVDHSGIATFVDLENVIIVNKTALRSGGEHRSVNYKCENCFSYSPDEICSHEISDHNIYAVCRELLSARSYLVEGGLLHSPPLQVEEGFPTLSFLVEECVDPSSTTESRFSVAEHLLDILQETIYYSNNHPVQ